MLFVTRKPVRTMSNTFLQEITRITTEVYGERYPTAYCIFLAGSVVRGENTHPPPAN